MLKTIKLEVKFGILGLFTAKYAENRVGGGES